MEGPFRMQPRKKRFDTFRKLGKQSVAAVDKNAPPNEVLRAFLDYQGVPWRATKNWSRADLIHGASKRLPVPDPVARMGDRVAALPSPGGLLTPLLVVLFMHFVIAAAGAAGETRMQLLWSLFRGRVRFQTEAANTTPAPAAPPQVGTPINQIGTTSFTPTTSGDYTQIPYVPPSGSTFTPQSWGI